MSRAFTAVMCAALISGCRGADFERMREQRRVDPYSTNMRTPPFGTIEHGNRGGSQGPQSQATMDPQQLALGHHQFQNYCAVCHGEDGGGGSTMAANMPG